MILALSLIWHISVRSNVNVRFVGTLCKDQLREISISTILKIYHFFVMWSECSLWLFWKVQYITVNTFSHCTAQCIIHYSSIEHFVPLTQPLSPHGLSPPPPSTPTLSHTLAIGNVK